MILLKLLLVPVCGLADRYRGDDELGFAHKTLDSIAFGLAVAYLAFDFQPYGMLIFAVLFSAAMAVGYGEPWGAVLNKRPQRDGEWWQFGALPNYPLLSLFFRGAIGAAFVSPVCFFYHNYAPMLALVLAFPISAFLAPLFYYRFRQHIPELLHAKLLGARKPIWNSGEIIRGTLIGLIVLLFSAFS